jgi:DNA-binding beta-propeller fold protein YncE
MSIRRAITLTGILVVTTLTLTVSTAGARVTRELITSFGSLENGSIDVSGGHIATNGVAGLAVDLETGNVYVADNNTQTIYIFGPTGGAPADGVPSQIAGVHISLYFEPSAVAVDNSCFEHEPRLTGKACEEYDPSYGDIYIMDTNTNTERGEAGSAVGIQKFKLNARGEYEAVGEIEYKGAKRHGLAIDSRGNIYTDDTAEASNLQTEPVVEFKKIVEKVVNGGVEELQEKLEELTFAQHITPGAEYVAVDDLGDVYVASGGGTWAR